MRRRVAIYCRCGGAMTGSVNLAATADELVAAFWRVHDGAEHGPATQKEAARARRLEDSRR